MQEIEKVLTEIEKTWLACTIDSEGSISLLKTKSRGENRYVPCIRIRNTCKEFVERAQQILGCGSIHCEAFPSKNWKDTYTLILNSNSIRGFLSEILPYIIIKRPQAQALLEALEILELRRSDGPFGNPRGCCPQKSEESRKWLEEIYLKMKELNKKGRGD